MSDVEFERRVEHALRAPLPANARARQAIMEGVRDVARDRAKRRLALPSIRTRHSLIGLAMAAGIGSITTLSTLVPSAGGRATGVVTSAIIGDSVVDRLRDTMRLVRLMFDDAAARQVSIVGDFNGWRQEATPMRRDARTGQWAVTVALHDGEHRYAVVVDNTRRAADSAPRGMDGRQRAYSLLKIARATN
ncbi:MAG: glycoside hydrolase family 13 domain protein [Gemmatimonadetes bacterium]|nr:glycoside hydrolase family 13 domain protein [Gemmatimonadota bacterium]